MADCIDSIARQQVGELRTDFTELATDYWGKDGTNGHRSRSNAAQKRLDAMEMNLGHYKDKERRETCFGLAGLAEHEKSHDKILATAVAQKVVDIQLADAKRNAKTEFIKAWGPGITALAALIIAFKEPIIAWLFGGLK